MSFKHAIIIFGLLMAAGIGTHISVRDGNYPVAIVNFGIITAKSVDEDFSAAYRYFQNAMLVSGSDPSTLDTPESKREIRRATLDKLITDLFVYNELKVRLGVEFQAIAEKNIEQFLKINSNIEEGAKKLYGLDILGFKRRVLQPQAYKEILEGRMFLANEKFDDWLKDRRAQASVIILTPDLQWKDGEVKLRG